MQGNLKILKTRKGVATMKRIVSLAFVGVFFIFLTASSSFAAFWLQPGDLSLDSIQTLGSSTYMTVTWSAGAQSRFYQVSPGLSDGDKNRIIATALTIKANGGTNFRLHINNSAEIDGIDIK